MASVRNGTRRNGLFSDPCEVYVHFCRRVCFCLTVVKYLDKFPFLKNTVVIASIMTEIIIVT